MLTEQIVEDAALVTAIRAAKVASEVILPFWPSALNGRFNPGLKLSIYQKNDGIGNYAATADLESGKKIAEIFQSDPLLQGFNLSCEETDDIDKGSEYTIVLDEIDGTIQFNNGSENFRVSIGVLKGTTPLIGVLASPSRQLVMVAKRGQGCWVENFNGDLIANLKTIPTNTDLADSKLLVGYDLCYHNKPSQLELVGKIVENFNNVVSYSSSTTMNWELALGHLSATFFEKLTRLDIGAVVPILEEVGGRVSQLDGSPVDFSKRFNSFIAARDPAVHQRVLNLIHSTGYRPPIY